MAETYFERVKSIRIDHNRSAVNFKNSDLRWAYNEGHRRAIDDASQIAAEADSEIEKLKSALRACLAVAEGVRTQHENLAWDHHHSSMGDEMDQAEQHRCAEDACAEIVREITCEMAKVGLS